MRRLAADTTLDCSTRVSRAEQGPSDAVAFAFLVHLRRDYIALRPNVTLSSHAISNLKKNNMAKTQNAKKQTKKQPAKDAKQKKAAKQVKKAAKK